MKRLMAALAGVLFTWVGAWSGAVFAVPSMQFGEPVDGSEAISVDTILDSPDDYLEAPVTISGKVTGVCAKKGCWLTVASADQRPELRVKVRDGDMVFPMSARGKDCLVKGQLKAMNLSIEQTRARMAHFAEDAGEKFDPASITEPMVVYQLAPTGVEIIN
ncbi:DUF4920 domain-containing protein [Paraferrimonas sedimenticola]|uniref:DUF4920 domain-containing protein n=1 Tax=Paraferrimonas sedimenticola TaxID=375674 RepID=A0AA37W1I2_9GAMM|nr:DUF4920 domain-containing protein [Paraferrimonas sedimenticola]GLP96267.1 hypothetical protein GCM10007895_15730 [Paraferrimonas sedimenticola]